MADLRIPATLPVAGAQTPARTTEAVRAAQRAFFDTALSNAAAPTPLRPAVSAAAVGAAQATPLKPPGPASADAQTGPTRILRPGSLLDIRV